MEPDHLHNYKHLVKRKLAKLAPIFEHVKLGDFSSRLEIPKADDDFRPFYVGVQAMLEVIQKQLGELEDLNSKLRQKAEGASSKLLEVEFQNVQDEAILENIGEALIVTDQRGLVLICNHQAQEITGFSQQQLLGQDPALLFSLEDEQGQQMSPDQHPVRLSVQQGKKIAEICYFKHSVRGLFPISIISTPLFLEGQIMGGVTVFRDIAQERAVDKAKSEFVSLASHQLRTPLTAIKWESARLLEIWDNPAITMEEKKSCVQKIYVTNERMMDLVSSILNVSKIDLGTLAVEPVHVHLEDLADSVLNELVQPIQEKSLHVKKEFGPLPSVVADPQLMRIVFQNLITNAIKYTPAQGTLTCGISFGKNELLITVSDTGCGIPKEDYGKMFTKFFRSQDARTIDPNGNGLGMYIVKAIVEEAGGKIWFESEEGKGTSFYVTIPLAGMKNIPGIKGLTESYA